MDARPQDLAAGLPVFSTLHSSSDAPLATSAGALPSAVIVIVIIELCGRVICSASGASQLVGQSSRLWPTALPVSVVNPSSRRSDFVPRPSVDRDRELVGSLGAIFKRWVSRHVLGRDNEDATAGIPAVRSVTNS